MKYIIYFFSFFQISIAFGQQSISRYFDSLGRITQELYPDSSFITYTYDNMGNMIGMNIHDPCSTKPKPIITASGPVTFCVGDSVFLTTSAGLRYKWSTGDTTQSIRIVVGGNVTVTRLDTFSVPISDTLQCYLTSDSITITVNPLPPSIAGVANVCIGQTTTLNDSISGGAWIGSNANATIDSISGIVTGVSSGTSAITYTLPTSCSIATTVMVNPLPSAILGTTVVCISSTTTLRDPGGGAWSCGNTGVANVGFNSGIVTGVSSGTAIITYTLTTGCLTTTSVLVNPLPYAGYVTGANSVCVGAAITLTDTVSGGVWNSSNANATVIGGVVNGITAGIDTIGYSYTNSCGTATATEIITINPLPDAGSITGSSTVSVGFAITLTDPAGAGAGTWSLSNGNGSVSGGLVTGITAGTSIVTYTVSNGCGTAIATKTITLIALPAITGITSLCVGSSSTLSNDSTGGIWNSGNTAIATIGSSSGIVTGVSAGTVTITYTVAGNSVTTVVTVNPLPSIITGITSVCFGLTTSLNDANSGGMWRSNNLGVAVIGSVSGIVSCITSGTASITYTLPTGCIAITTVTVNPLPSAITGTFNVCAGLTTTLSDAGGGTWTSGTISVAIVSSGTGIVLGVAAGTATITYTLPTGCISTAPIIVNPLPSAITGTTNVCLGLTTTLSDIGGGKWSSGNSAIANVGSGTGIVTGLLAGGVGITYTLPTGCITTTTFAVNPLPLAITGGIDFCVSATTTLSDATTGGTWSSGNIGIATIGSTTGIVSGIVPGSALITYMLGTGCLTTTSVLVMSTPSSITGPTSVCAGSSITLTDITSGGTWSSSNPAIAIIDPSLGVVTGIAAGTATMTYSLPCGVATSVIRVIGLPAAITGTTNVCYASTTTLHDATTGGVWSSTNTAVATIGSTSGIVSGLTGGTATISYTVSSGCAATTTVNVNSFYPITGYTTVCVGYTTTLNHATPGGIWTSNKPAVATVNCNLGIVTGVSAGTAVITYSFGTGCSITATVTVVDLLSNTGITRVCAGSTTTLSNAAVGGVWSSSDSTIASVDSITGIVTGQSLGTAIIGYSIGTSGCITNSVITVLILSPNTGNPNVCTGLTTTLNNDESGGTWSSSSVRNASVTVGTGIVTGVTVGTAIITYNFGRSCIATTPITINPIPAPVPVSGGGTFCGSTTITASGIGGETVYFQGTISGGTSIATPSTSQVITSSGTYYFRAQSLAGCWSNESSVAVTIPAISGPTTACLGSTGTLTGNVGSGVWSSNSSDIATIGSLTGIVTGLTVGTTIVTYTHSGCVVSTTVTVSPTPPTISGPGSVCLGQTMTLGHSGSGGSWYSSTPTIASVDINTGMVTGIASGYGSAAITYVLGTSCKATKSISVSPVSPIIVTGPPQVCIGQTLILGDATTGGRWSSSDATVGVGSTSGIITGISTGTATISYILPTGCTTTTSITVKVLTGITGPSNVCVGQTMTLSDATPGGTWYSSAPTIATAGLTSGIVTGIAAGYGTANITYYLSTGCKSSQTVTINPLAAISSPPSVCQGQTLTMHNAISGGIWSSGNILASIGSITGIVTGLSGGLNAITYSLPTGCMTSTIITINPIAPITGPRNVCVGQTITLNDATEGGTWSSSAPTIATVGTGSGIVTGIASVLTNPTISYTLCTGCKAFVTITVNALSAISGLTSVCSGQTITLSDAVTGGSWSFNNTGIATIGSGNGIVTGLSSGFVVCSYVLPTGCTTTKQIVVNPLSVITGPTNVCQGQTMTLNDATGGGVWSSSSPTVARIGSNTGIVTGVSGSNIATISYTLSTGCKATKVVSVNALPTVAAITGPSSVSISGSSITLSDATTGGKWSSGNNGIATVGSTTGVVRGINSGIVPISYTITNTFSCSTIVIKNITVGSIPPPHGGIINDSVTLCIGKTIKLKNVVAGGLWSSSNMDIATVDAETGYLTGIAAGQVCLTHTVTNLSGITTYLTLAIINPLPDLLIITVKPNADIASERQVTLTALVSNGGTMPTYQWYINNELVLGATFATFINNFFSENDSVTCVVSSNEFDGYSISKTIYFANSILEIKPSQPTQMDVRIHPNPNKGEFIIEGSLGTDIDEELTIEISDMFGQVVHTDGAISRNGVIYKLIKLHSSLADGMYILKILNGRENLVFHVVVEK